MRIVIASAVVALGLVAAAYAEVTVETTGSAKVKPDVAYLTFSVSQRGTEFLKVDAAVRQRAKQLADKLAKLPGVRGCKVKVAQTAPDSSSSYSDGMAPPPRIFKGTCAVTVECGPDEAIVNKVVSGALENGVELGSDSFRGYPGSSMASYGVTKAEEGEAQAFADALKKAKTKARRVADQAGLKLGQVTDVLEVGSFSPYPGYPMSPVDDSDLLEYAGPDPQSVQITVRFRITFETE
jgi:uncharacterized protein YggE